MWATPCRASWWLFHWSSSPPARSVVYQTLALLVFAFLVLFLPLAIGASRASLMQVPPRTEEAARSLGRTPANVMRTITAPLMARGVAAGAALVFLTAIKGLHPRR